MREGYVRTFYTILQLFYPSKIISKFKVFKVSKKVFGKGNKCLKCHFPVLLHFTINYKSEYLLVTTTVRSTARLQQYMNREFPDVQAGFRKGRGTRDQIANICRSEERRVGKEC